MSNLTASIYMDWGQPLRIFTGTVEQDSLEVPFFVSVRDFAENVGSSTIKRWGSASMPCPDSIKISNNILTNKQEPHYHCTAVPFVEIRKMVNNTDMHPRNKDRANAIIKWLESIYKEYTKTCSQLVKPSEATEAVISSHEQEKSEYRRLREAGMSVPEALTAVLGKPVESLGFTVSSSATASEALTVAPDESEQRPRTTCDTIVPVSFTVDDVAKRLYELKKENEDLKAEVKNLKKDLEEYRAIRDMFLSIGGD